MRLKNTALFYTIMVSASQRVRSHPQGLRVSKGFEVGLNHEYLCNRGLYKEVIIDLIIAFLRAILRGFESLIKKNRLRRQKKVFSDIIKFEIFFKSHYSEVLRRLIFQKILPPAVKGSDR